MPSTDQRILRTIINLSSLLLSQSLQTLLQGSGGICATISHNLHPPADFQPDIIIVDENTLRQNPQTRWTTAKIILLDIGVGEERIITQLLSCRLDGVISVDTNAALFTKALHAVGTGQVWIDNAKLKALLNHVESISKTQRRESISKKEREIIILISQGHRNREIADKLCISEQTVKSHLSRIFRKTNVTSRSQLVPIALKYITLSSL
jgi:LuxR family transcriptional regulator, positive regulator of biofilm formation